MQSVGGSCGGTMLGQTLFFANLILLIDFLGRSGQRMLGK